MPPQFLNIREGSFKMKTKLTTLLNIEYPIIQGGMAWVANAKLASAVSNGGGLGVIAGGNAPADVIREQIRLTKASTDKPFGVNVMLLSPFADDIMQLCLDEEIKIIITGAGSPGKYIERINQVGAMIIPVVPSVALAKRMERMGATAVVCEGQEAGGHIGELTTMTLVPMVCDELSIPVIAAGGIADGRGLAAALMLGAIGVQIGTRFLTATECDIHNNYKQCVIDAKDTSTVVTGKFTGHPVRTLKNRCSRMMLSKEKEGISIEEFEKLGAGSMRNGVIDGDDLNGSFMAGQIAGLCKKEQPAALIMQEIVSQATDLMTNIEKNRGVCFE